MQIVKIFNGGFGKFFEGAARGLTERVVRKLIADRYCLGIHQGATERVRKAGTDSIFRYIGIRESLLKSPHGALSVILLKITGESLV